MAHKPVQRAIKRGIDIIGATTLLAAGSPLLVGAGLAIKATSPGPLFYRWRVAGLGGRPLVSYKFRTMVVNADALKATLLPQNEMRGPVFKMTHDPRVTPIGKLLRKTSIDELPQLWSVLKGDLSLVGPRPPLQTEYAAFNAWQRQKMQVKPGMTCLWQVRGRNRIADFDEWVALDLEYIRTWSLLTDLKILLATIPAVVRGGGAS
jgi:lipopolysaccharide/colanic/teichoic acid biosynthesis glycosyltransferase